jgi:hypothetical protein
MRQEVIAYEEAEENEIINEALEVESEWQLKVLEFKEKVLTNDCNLDELKLD